MEETLDVALEQGCDLAVGDVVFDNVQAKKLKYLVEQARGQERRRIANWLRNFISSPEEMDVANGLAGLLDARDSEEEEGGGS